MTFTDFLRAFLRQTAYAAATLVVALFVAERLAPGSVLAYVNLFWAAVGAFGLLCAAVLGES